MYTLLMLRRPDMQNALATAIMSVNSHLMRFTAERKKTTLLTHGISTQWNVLIQRHFLENRRINDIVD